MLQAQLMLSSCSMHCAEWDPAVAWPGKQEQMFELAAADVQIPKPPSTGVKDDDYLICLTKKVLQASMASPRICPGAAQALASNGLCTTPCLGDLVLFCSLISTQRLLMHRLPEKRGVSLVLKLLTSISTDSTTSLVCSPALRIEQWRCWQVISPPLILKGGK